MAEQNQVYINPDIKRAYTEGLKTINDGVDYSGQAVKIFAKYQERKMTTGVYALTAFVLSVVGSILKTAQCLPTVGVVDNLTIAILDVIDNIIPGSPQGNAWQTRWHGLEKLPENEIKYKTDSSARKASSISARTRMQKDFCTLFWKYCQYLNIPYKSTSIKGANFPNHLVVGLFKEKNKLVARGMSFSKDSIAEHFLLYCDGIDIDSVTADFNKEVRQTKNVKIMKSNLADVWARATRCLDWCYPKTIKGPGSGGMKNMTLWQKGAHCRKRLLKSQPNNVGLYGVWQYATSVPKILGRQGVANKGDIMKSFVRTKAKMQNLVSSAGQKALMDTAFPIGPETKVSIEAQEILMASFAYVKPKLLNRVLCPLVTELNCLLNGLLLPRNQYEHYIVFQANRPLTIQPSCVPALGMINATPSSNNDILSMVVTDYVARSDMDCINLGTTKTGEEFTVRTASAFAGLYPVQKGSPSLIKPTNRSTIERPAINFIHEKVDVINEDQRMSYSEAKDWIEEEILMNSARIVECHEDYVWNSSGAKVKQQIRYRDLTLDKPRLDFVNDAESMYQVGSVIQGTNLSLVESYNRVFSEWHDGDFFINGKGVADNNAMSD